jgi:hypothetical protein
MQFTYLNLISALAIGLVIFGLAILPSIRAKALLYVFPIPISIGLIATHGKITASNLMGVMLVWMFMWMVKTLVTRGRFNIIVADIVAALSYIALGYALVNFVHLQFWVVLSIFVLLWATLVSWMHAHPLRDKPFKPSTLSPIAKGGIAAVVSYGIYSVQHILAGIVVTFPYNGIFAVVEAQQHLAPFSRAVIRNTIALGAMFTSMYFLQADLSLALNLIVGWISFGIVVFFAQRISV